MSIFLNMTANSRGMMVIGVLVGAFVLAGFSALFSTGSEKAMGGTKSIEGMIRDQEREIDLDHASIGELTRQQAEAEKRRATSKEADEAALKVQANRKRINELEEGISNLLRSIEAETQALEDGKQRYRKQLLADPAATEFPELRTLSGKVYQNVRITSIDAASVTISHRDGSGRVALSDLPAELRKRFP